MNIMHPALCSLAVDLMTFARYCIILIYNLVNNIPNLLFFSGQKKIGVSII